MKNMKKTILLTIAICLAFGGGAFYYYTLNRAEIIKNEKPIPLDNYWTVHWSGYYVSDYGSVYEKPRQNFFLTEGEAIAFKERLKEAFDLVVIEGKGTKVDIVKHPKTK